MSRGHRMNRVGAGARSAGVVALLLAAPAPPGLAAQAVSLWYDRPATEWIEALPVGNGRLGGMVFGGVAEERIQFNESTLWNGGPHDYTHAGASEVLPQLRSLLFEGRQAAADSLASRSFMSVPLTQMSYQAFGDLHLRFRGLDGEVTAYRRDLDLRRAVATTQFRVNGVTYTREVFASHPAGVLVVHLRADRPGALNVSASLASAHRGAERTHIGADQLSMRGGVENGAIRFEARLLVRADGGTVTMSDTVAVITRATSATLILAGATNFVRYDDVSADPAARTEHTLRAVRDVAHADLLADHARDHRELFDRTGLDLGAGADAVRSLPTDRRIETYAPGRDPELVALLFQYGRYLLIASSRPGGQPANLQGLWNDSNRPPWGSKYTVNINTEMNYWLAEPTGLGELAAPLFSLIEDVSRTGTRTARVHYDLPGWVLHHNTDLWRGSAPIDGPQWGLWPTGGAWLTQHLWWRWEYGGSRTFLQDTAYPLMRGAAQFFVHYLVPDPRTGHLISGPSVSPENRGIVMGPTMDHQLLRDLFARTIAASEILGVDAAFRDTLQHMRSRLAPNRVGRLGQLQEWLEDRDDPDDRHRHVSHLWGLHPGSEITREGTPELFAAARRSLELRGDGGTGWSRAWKINFWARLQDGDRALALIDSMIRPTRERRVTEDGGFYPNLFSAHSPFQIDGNFGFTAGVVEMLMQNHQGDVHLLPALPAAWPDGSVTGLRARGGFAIDMTWRQGVLAEAVVQASRGGDVRIRYRGQVRHHRLRAGERVVFRPGAGVGGGT